MRRDQQAIGLGHEVDTERPLMLVSDEPLLDELLRLAAAAGCEPERAPDVVAARRRWSTAPLVLLDETGLAACVAEGLPRRGGIIVAALGEPSRECWPNAVDLGAEKVLGLPAEEAWLAGALADVVECPAATAGRVIAVVGGRGGAGASVLASSIALTALRRSSGALLVDCDPLGAGIDLVLGAEGAPGLRWPEVTVSGGRVTMSSLRSALPGHENGSARLTVVSCDRDGPGPAPEALTAVIDCGRRCGDTVVCDLPRSPSPAADTAVDQADLTVLVVPAEVRACASARLVAARFAERGADVRVIVRGPAPGGLTAEHVADVVGAPLLTSMRPEPLLPRTIENVGLRLRQRGPLTTVAETILDTPLAAGLTGVTASGGPS